MDGTEIDDWGPFGPPLFNDPSVKHLERVGVLDVGSNSVRLVIFDGAARSPAYFFNEKLLCGLGRGVKETGRLDPEGRRRALGAMRRFAKLLEAFECSRFSAVATAAVRDARDGDEFRDEVERETGIQIHVIDGIEEARLAAQGVLLGWPSADGVVCDIGGSSMEIARVGRGEVGERATTPLGPQMLSGLGGGKKAVKAAIRAAIAQIAPRFAGSKRLYLVGGSWRSIARIDMERRDYPLKVLHEYVMTPTDVRETVKFIAETGIEALRADTGTSLERMELVPLASQVLKETVKALGAREICVSAYGLREGLLYEEMPDQLKRRDPLIEAARFAEAKDARIPGFGRRLFHFLQPLHRNASAKRLRLIRAACLLHDVSWRAHSDHRHEVCFDNVTRANLGGLDHKGRVFIGLSLLHRYKNSRAGSHFEPYFNLLTERERGDAEALGKAMRFGAMFAPHASDHMSRLEWQPKKKILRLMLDRHSSALWGEVAEARFASLAAALGAECQMKIKGLTSNDAQKVRCGPVSS